MYKSPYTLSLQSTTGPQNTIESKLIRCRLISLSQPPQQLKSLFDLKAISIEIHQSTPYILEIFKTRFRNKAMDLPPIVRCTGIRAHAQYCRKSGLVELHTAAMHARDKAKSFPVPSPLGITSDNGVPRNNSSFRHFVEQASCDVQLATPRVLRDQDVGSDDVGAARRCPTERRE